MECNEYGTLFHAARCVGAGASMGMILRRRTFPMLET
jgi:hypothetical protein